MQIKMRPGWLGWEERIRALTQNSGKGGEGVPLLCHEERAFEKRVPRPRIFSKKNYKALKVNAK
jgi:hypothetical protein